MVFRNVNEMVVMVDLHNCIPERRMPAAKQKSASGKYAREQIYRPAGRSSTL